MSSARSDVSHFDRNFALNQTRYRERARRSQQLPTPLHRATATGIGLAFVVMVLLLFTGCAPEGYVRADAIKGTLLRVAERHDAYTKADKDLKESNRKRNLRDTALLRRLMEEATKTGAPKGEAK